MVRVVAGTAGGLRLKTNDSADTRPTLDRVKEAMFSMISPYLPSSVVLDLFAGNGGLGIEALSRGAKYAVFNDQSGRCGTIIRENLCYTRLQERGEVLTVDYRTALQELAARSLRFSVVLLDPPYGKGLIERSCAAISQLKLAQAGGILIAEHALDDCLPEQMGVFRLIKDKQYGKVILSLFAAEIL